MGYRLFFVLFVTACSLYVCSAVKTRGVFYLMGSDGIYVIDPEEKRLVTKITNTSSPGLCTRPPPPFDRSSCMFSDGHVVGDLLFVANPPGNTVNVIDLNSQKKTEAIPTDPSPYGLYSVSWRNELWVHSWTNSTFDVIETERRTRTHSAVRAHVKPGWIHGLMLAQQNLLDGKTGYVSHLWNPGFHKLNLETKTYSGFINLTSHGCSGTYGLVYSQVNKHLFVECRGGRRGRSSIKLLEMDVNTDNIVNTLSFPGTPFVSPNGRYIVVVYSPVNETSWKLLDSKISVLEIKVSAVSKHPELNITGGVSEVVFYPKSTGTYYAFVTIKYESKMAVIDLEDDSLQYIDNVGAFNTRVHGASRAVLSGGKWIISPATQSKAVAIIDAETRKLHGMVNDVNGGRHAVWVDRGISNRGTNIGVQRSLVYFGLFVLLGFVRPFL